MKIAAFLYAYPPDRQAGADLMSADLLAALVEDGHEVVVFSTLGTPARTDRGVTIQSRTQFRRNGGWDAVYAHPDLGGEPADYARRLRVPYIAVVHNTDARTGRWLRQNPPTLTVWNSESTRAAHGGEGGIVVRSPLRMAEHTVKRGDTDAVTLVNLNRAKGADLFWALAAARPTQSFIGVRGWYGLQQEQQRRNVRVVGPLRYPLREVWAQTRVLLMPSESESWGRVGLEAACCGIPTIAHPTPGLQESLGGAGFFVDRGDTAGWLAALDRLDDPQVYEARSLAACVRARQVEARSGADLQVWREAVAALLPRPAALL